MATQRYAAFLRGVSPMNLKMPLLKQALEKAGMTDVQTLLSSGNVLFTTQRASDAVVQKRLEAAMEKGLHRPFLSFVRSVDFLRELLASDPYAKLKVAAKAKKVVTFLRKPPEEKLTLPLRKGGASVLAIHGLEVFSAYVVNHDEGPVFMTLLQKTFGEEITTRTWDTVTKAAADRHRSS